MDLHGRFEIAAKLAAKIAAKIAIVNGSLESTVQTLNFKINELGVNFLSDKKYRLPFAWKCEF